MANEIDLIDFADMEKTLLDGLDDDEKEVILDGIQLLKNTFNFAKFNNSINTDIENSFYDGDEEAGFAFQRVAYDYLYEKYPEFAEDDNDDGKGEFMDEFLRTVVWREKKVLTYKTTKGKNVEIVCTDGLVDEFFVQAYEQVDDNITDEMRRSATIRVAEEFGLPFAIVEYLYKKGFLPNAIC